MAPSIAIIGGGPSGLAFARLLECNNIDYIVFERNTFANRDHGQQGGSLDIHGATGQETLRRGGLSAEFEKYARRDATMVRVLDMHGKERVTFGQGRDAPEIDRVQLRRILVDSIPAHSIQWGKVVETVERDENQNIVIRCADGSSFSGFGLVVGADGTWSRVRHLLTTAKPRYSGMSYIEGRISVDNSQWATINAQVGPGTLLAFGPRKQLAAQQMSDGSYRVYMGLVVPESWLAGGDSSVDLVAEKGAQARRAFTLDNDNDAYFGSWAPSLKSIIASCEGPFRRWPLYHMPLVSMPWRSQPGVTLLGDAAHVSTPFVGEGVNCALFDALVLADKVVEHGLGRGLARAVEEYEKDMFARARDVLERSMASGRLLFADDAPRGLVEVLKGPAEKHLTR